ncbi:coiled-coil domain-containing protein 187 isoform X1 [Rissa tridactyla]|uniref:coiled-coil domain-containing protein 187 isoform X1 n=3 Tax=Rissa tridactyla TaxID=75485 RepID=UPI0023BAC6F1|nr:coiled-coil domain-containing protein 187 isoform X1 [Rissa tridactyla]
MDNSFASGESDPLSDVALAWKSLLKAKAVLQRIENKFYHQTWSCAKSQAARRKLWHEKSFDGERNRDETAMNEKKSNEIPPACRKGNCAALSPAWSQSCFLESPAVSSGPSRMTPLSSRGDSCSAPCSPARREAEDGESTAGTRSPAKSLYRPRWDNFREQSDSRGRAVEREKSPCCLHHPPRSPAGSSLFSAVPHGSRSNAPMPMAVLLPTYHLPSASRRSDQKLEELWKKSPQKKLEQLKKRIQEQKQKQQAASQEQKCLTSAYAKEPPQKRPLKRKVCKVASAPPAPAYRDQRERSSARRIQMQSQRQPSPKSSALERTVKDKCKDENHEKLHKLMDKTTGGAKLPGASAWREGQKLARKLLGPLPTFPNLRSTAEEQTTANTFEPGRGFVAMPAMENSSREKGNEPVGKSPEFKSYAVPPSKPIERGSSAPTKGTKQILRNLHLQSQCHDDHRRTRLVKDIAKGKVEVLQRYPGMHSPSSGPRGITPSAFRGEKAQSSLMEDGAEPSRLESCSRGKSTSQRQKGSSSPAKKGSEKENLKHPSKRRVNIKKPHPYSPEIVQEFMQRKNEERRKKRLEKKKSLVQAMEMRNKRLQEVYRKQKEAIGKKTCSDQLCKFIGETAPAKESPQPKLEQEQISGGILESSFMTCVDKTPCTLLSKDHRSRNQLLYMAQSPQKRAALPSPAPRESECWFLSPLKCEDLRDCSPPALRTPPLSFSLPQKHAKSYSKDLTSGLSPYRSKQDRVKAIHSLSKELAEKIEMATKRLNAASWIKDSADKTSTETTLDLYNELSSVPKPETSKDEQDRTMTIQMLLDTPDPDVLRVSSDREFHRWGRISLVGSTKGATALEREKEISVPLPGGRAMSKELPWTHNAGQRHLNTGKDLSNTLQGFPVNKGSEVDISLLHEKPITSPASPSHRFLTRSPQRELTAQKNHYQCETIFKVQNQEEIANWSPREILRTPDSFRSQPSATLSPGAETHHSFEQDFASAGEGDSSCTELEEKHKSHLDNLRQTSLLLAHKLKVHQLQQRLTVLREKAKLELQESQRCLNNLLQHNSEECSRSKGSCYFVPKLDHAEQMWRGPQSEGDNAAGSNEETHSLKQSALQTERDHSPVDSKTVGERKPWGGRDSYCSGLQEGSLPVEHGEPLHDHQTLNLLSPLMNLPHGETRAGDDSGDSSERASSDSQWSEVGRHYGDSSTFCCFSLAMVEQCLRGEELRARHQAALFKLRKKALREKARAELAWLGHQKCCLESLRDSEGASAMAAKQHKILTELKQEQAEIQHLQNIYRAAHQERKLLLKQQREILMMRRSTAQLQEKLTRSPATDEGIRLKTVGLISSPKLSSSSAEPTAHPERPDLSGNRESCVRLKNKKSKKYEDLSTENKKTLVQYQKQVEDSTGLEQTLDAQGPDASETVTNNICGATSQTTGSVFMIKECINTELNAQDHVLLPLEHANSSRMDEPISTPITRESRKYAFLESVLNEKAFISNSKTDPKDNEDINPCDSKFTAKGLGMLSTLCNLCLVQAENTLQGTGDATLSLEDLEKESLIVEKVHKEQRSHKTLREEQEVCSPFQAGKRKKDLSSDDEDGERSALISDEATSVKTQLRKERSSEEQRVSTDSEKKSEITHIDEKASSEISLPEVKEVKVPVPYEIHQVDGNQCLKHLDHICHEASDEELNLTAFSEGLASTESSSKSNNFSLRCESAKSDSSLPEFQKVSAVWVDISGSLMSDSELELKNGEDTDVSISEEFVYDNGVVFPDVSKERLIAISNGKETLPSYKHDEHEAPTGDSTETSSHFQKYPGDVSGHGCSDNLFSFVPSDKTNASKTKSAHCSQSDNSAKGMDVPHLDDSENYSRSKTPSREITKQGKDAVASFSCSDGIYSPKIHEQQKPSSPTSSVEKDGGINTLFVDQNSNLMGFPLTGSLKCLDLVTDQFSSSRPPDKAITNDKLLACLSSRNLSVSGAENNHVQLLNERLTSTKLGKIVSLSTSRPEILKEVHTETNSSESSQRIAMGNQNNSTTERQAIKEARRELFSSVSSKIQLFQVKNCSSKGEDDTIFISDEDLPPTHEDTLSEILSPVDDVLSYGSADLPSSNKKDLSFPSEDLPPPLLSADAMKNDDPSFSMDDFPSPPEQMTVSETRQCTDGDISLKMDALPPLPDNTVPEEFPLLNQEITNAFSTQDGSLSEQSLVKDISSAKEGLLEYQQGEHETPLQHLEFLPVSNPISSGQTSKSPDSMMKQCKTNLTLPKAEEDSDDPLISFEIGDRVLVKQTQPGTLMFKGRTCFDSGHWAGVALDKAEGDHAGTYKGVKYFECAQHCGVFVRPEEISHLLGANENASNYTRDEDSDSFYDDESFKGDCKSSEDDEQGGGLTERKAEDTNTVGGSEVKENQSRLHIALLSGKGQKLPRSDQCKCNEFLHQNNLMCLGLDKDKTELTQIKQRILAGVLPIRSKTSNTDEVKPSKNICCLVEDQKINKLADDIASELAKKLLFDTLIAFSETAQHKYKSAFEKDMMNYGKSLRQEDNQKLFLLKENSVALLSEQPAKVSDVLLRDLGMLSIHGCHTVAERIVTKFVDDAVKEYKKIKRKHGSKADKIFHSSSETSPTTLPFLVKILDAGVFGSSEDFDQPNSDQHMLVRQRQKQYLYKLDQWRSAPWKKTAEVPLVIPHYSSYVKKLSAYAVEELWTPENIYSNFRRISVPKHFECNDLPGNDLETESKRMYNQVIFDLTHELLCAEYQVATNPNTFPWMKENLGSYCSRHLCRRTDVNEVKMFVQGEIIKIMNLEKNDLEMKRKFLNMTKYGNCKRDRVDLVLIQELHKEESQWTYYDDDELTVKMRMTEDIFDSLILDTIRVLNKIYLRKACD